MGFALPAFALPLLPKAVSWVGGLFGGNKIDVCPGEPPGDMVRAALEQTPHDVRAQLASLANATMGKKYTADSIISDAHNFAHGANGGSNCIAEGDDATMQAAFQQWWAAYGPQTLSTTPFPVSYLPALPPPGTVSTMPVPGSSSGDINGTIPTGGTSDSWWRDALRTGGIEALRRLLETLGPAAWDRLPADVRATVMQAATPIAIREAPGALLAGIPEWAKWAAGGLLAAKVLRLI